MKLLQEALENSKDGGSNGTSQSDFSSPFHNELYVLANGLSGSVDEFKAAARQAIEPGAEADEQISVGSARETGEERRLLTLVQDKFAADLK